MKVEARWNSKLNNEEQLGAHPVHHKGRRLWELECKCLVWKSRHAVRVSWLENERDGHGEGTAGPWEPACFRCPLHGPFYSQNQPKASSHAREAHALLCQIAQALSTPPQPCVIVWEPQVVRRHKGFDFWLRGQHKIVVEVDGWQHGWNSMHGTCPQDQLRADRVKSVKA